MRIVTYYELAEDCWESGAIIEDSEGVELLHFVMEAMEELTGGEIVEFVKQADEKGDGRFYIECDKMHIAKMRELLDAANEKKKGIVFF